MVYANIGQILGTSKEPVAFCNDPEVRFEVGDLVQHKHLSERKGYIQDIKGNEIVMVSNFFCEY